MKYKKILNIKIPVAPISINAMYKISRHRMYMTAKAKEFKDFVGFNLIKQIKQIHFNREAKYKLEIDYYIQRDKDIDNMNKATIDACQDIIFEDDRQIMELNCRKFFVKKEEQCFEMTLYLLV